MVPVFPGSMSASVRLGVWAMVETIQEATMAKSGRVKGFLIILTLRSNTEETAQISSKTVEEIINRYCLLYS